MQNQHSMEIGFFPGMSDLSWCIRFVLSLKIMVKKCQKCNKEFTPNKYSPNQIYCGSKTKKAGCSWRNNLDKRRIYFLNHLREWFREYDRKWKVNKRKTDPKYKKKSLELTHRWASSESGKIWLANYKRDMPSKLESNRQRRLIKKGVIGKHTSIEWKDCKIKHNYACAICLIKEIELKGKYAFHISKLTKDHIIPISKGGTDNIVNIQPLCIGCNARKHNKIKI